MRKEKYMSLKQYVKMINVRREQILYEYFISQMKRHNADMLKYFKY